jgi:hypothetical protein
MSKAGEINGNKEAVERQVREREPLFFKQHLIYC